VREVTRLLSGVSSDKFWTTIENLVATSEAVIDRPRGSRHPKVREAIYPCDYGYLKGTVAADGEGIDIWLGSTKRPRYGRPGIRRLRRRGRRLHGCRETDRDLRLPSPPLARTRETSWWH
jgi:hypothetical protein